MLRKFGSAALILAALGVSGAALADDEGQYYPNAITLRAGIAVPVDKNISDYMGNALVNVGVEYLLQRPLLSNGDTYLSLDYFFKGFGGKEQGTVLPFTINQRVYTSNAEFRSYYFFGIGATYFDTFSTGTAITFRGGVGQELGSRIIAEIAAYISDSANGNRANAITFNVGYRF